MSSLCVSIICHDPDVMAGHPVPPQFLPLGERAIADLRELAAETLAAAFDHFRLPYCWKRPHAMLWAMGGRFVQCRVDSRTFLYVPRPAERTSISFRFRTLKAATARRALGSSLAECGPLGKKNCRLPCRQVVAEGEANDVRYAAWAIARAVAAGSTRYAGSRLPDSPGTELLWTCRGDRGRIFRTGSIHKRNDEEFDAGLRYYFEESPEVERLPEDDEEEFRECTPAELAEIKYREHGWPRV